VRIVDEFSADDGVLEVATIQWPAQRTLRATRLARRQPSLLLIEPGAPVPFIDAVLEDWTLATASFNELEARREAVRRRAAALREHSPRSASPSLDLDGVLRIGDRSVILAPIEVRLLRAFLARPGSVLSREELAATVWPDGAPKSNSLNVRLTHLRRRLAPLGFSFLTFSNRGYMLELVHDETILTERSSET
jgi:DNA-binding response OmpR family regulator